MLPTRVFPAASVTSLEGEGRWTVRGNGGRAETRYKRVKDNSHVHKTHPEEPPGWANSRAFAGLVYGQRLPVPRTVPSDQRALLGVVKEVKKGGSNPLFKFTLTYETMEVRVSVTGGCVHMHGGQKSSPVRVKGEYSVTAEFSASTVSAAFFSDFRVQELRGHQACQDLKAEWNEKIHQLQQHGQQESTV